MMVSYLVKYTPDGHLVPASKASHAALERDYRVDDVFRVEQVDDPTGSSRRHWRYLIDDAWKTLPEALADEFPEPEHLYQYAKIKAGHCTIEKILCANATAAGITAKTRKNRNPYSIVQRHGSVVTIYEPLPTGKGSGVSRKEFQQLKERVLKIVSEIIGVDVETLRESDPA